MAHACVAAVGLLTAEIVRPMANQNVGEMLAHAGEVDWRGEPQRVPWFAFDLFSQVAECSAARVFGQGSARRRGVDPPHSPPLGRSSRCLRRPCCVTALTMSPSTRMPSFNAASYFSVWRSSASTASGTAMGGNSLSSSSFERLEGHLRFCLLGSTESTCVCHAQLVHQDFSQERR